MDVLLGSQLFFSNLGSPAFSNYAPTGAGMVAVTARPSGQTGSAGQRSELTAVAGLYYSLLLTDAGAGYQSAILADQSIAAPAGQVSLRLIESAPVAGPVDVYLLPNAVPLANASPVFSLVAPGTVSAYTNLTAGDYTVIVTGAGSLIPKLDGSTMTLSGGQVRTLLLVDQKHTSDAEVLMVVGDDVN